MQGRHVWILQYRHSKIHQWGPEWHSWHVHWIKVLSDLIILKECAQAWAWAIAIFTVPLRLRLRLWFAGLERLLFL